MCGLHSALNRRFFCALLLTAGISGCAGFGTSRWAMDDPVYAEKYGSGYSEDDADKFARMLKQSMDARHLHDRCGAYAGIGGVGLEAGGFHYFNPSTEVRVGAKGLINFDAAYGGVDLGARFQTPTRVAPFLGAGVFLGSGRRSGLDFDGIDNNDNGIIDESNERGKDTLFAVYPEAGVHFWMNSRLRISAVGQYHFAPSGDQEDYGYVGLQLSLLEAIREWHGNDPEWTSLSRDD